ncbi:DUF6504 family protein [Klenkia sp. PcliD-1-E]|uniref:DUF6504 family protein n=1 Tax=Klenkia sp. PcliD-1-E TaxID=2954492 RepID=UPI00209832FE|nr:DUF6504 family protein [Klenkia sp. PcliD-1-E]MCO7219777.1 DUF6504 family protein [Klenkia sp. PcliD-1-E]
MVQVLVGAGERVQVECGPAGPLRFWRGEGLGRGRYDVGQVVEHRVEHRVEDEVDHQVGIGAGRDVGAAGPGRQVWRVEAVRTGRSRSSFAGVFDLSWEPAADRWSLVRVHD